MKTFITLLVVVSAFVAKAQSSFEYKYDDAGNRTLRKVITLNQNREGKEEIIKDEDDRFSFTLFPNPTEGLLTIESDENFLSLTGKKAMVYDLKGNIIAEFNVTNTLIPIDLKANESGTYVVKVLGQGYAKEWKVIKL